MAESDLAHDGRRPGTVVVRDLLLWGMAALAVTGLHAATAWWVMRPEPLLPAEDAAPTALMIELAPLVSAPEAAEEEIATEDENAQQVEAKPVEPPEEVTPETSPEEQVTPRDEPVEELPEENPAEDPPEPDVAVPDTAPVSDVALTRSLRPQARPHRAEPRREPKAQPAPKRQQPSQAARKSQVQADSAPVAAAPQTSRGTGRSVSPARWQSRLMAHLERRKRYPSRARARKEEGTAYVRFSIDDRGNVLSVALARSSGFAELDNAVLALVRRASPVPAPPPGVSRTITAPVRFNLR